MDVWLRWYLWRHPRDASGLQHRHRLNQVPRSIVVYSNTALGDTLMSTPALKALRESFPAAHITLFIHEKIHPLFAHFPYVDAFLLYYGGYRGFLRNVRELRSMRPDCILIFHANGPQDIPSAVLSGCNIILKSPTCSPYSSLLSHQFTFPSGVHTIEERLEIVRFLGGRASDMRMVLSPEYSQSTERQYFSDHNVVIGFQVGASDIYKTWPIESFCALAVQLLNHNNNIIIALCGTAQERAIAEKVVQVDPLRVKNYCGNTQIAQLPWLVREFNVLVSNDTGTMHVAVALGVPTVGLFASTNPSHTGIVQDLDKHVMIVAEDCVWESNVPKKQRSNVGMGAISANEVYQCVCRHIVTTGGG
ncbi:glycosyltransferase family 9 protein [Chrysiogenes arsenatis]|uniref:glycosyltransferase family 9 protein n=1 Tax=Chrysiogenes arsenatis TaxID=309797 RepID=UPI001267FA94|nr:glycosyltransferase family 9 protein [Chrysiogenes arsenatis]